MPANKKHLTKSGWLRFMKLLIGTLGGYTVMLTFHLVLSKIFPPENVVVTSFFTGYVLWAVLLLVAFLGRNIFKVGGIYIVLTLAFTGLYLIA